MYADDTSVTCSDEDIDELCNDLRTEDDNIAECLFFIFHFKLFKHKIPVFLPKTYLDAAALPGSRVFVFFQLLKQHFS